MLQKPNIAFISAIRHGGQRAAIPRLETLRYAHALGNLEIISLVEEGEQQLFTVNMYDYESACNTALRLIGYAEIVESLDLREFVSERISTMFRKHTRWFTEKIIC
ncbi:hypothetical protein [Paenibacillus sp. NPDC057934]|uniref:hypothetical protein n=1 Tax=Paenibacillus sp. NPDC057934 TaxID=3346282 RepID=UPI0036DB940C